MNRIIIGSIRPYQKEPNKVTVKLVHFVSEFTKVGFIKLHISYYGEVLSNPRIENLTDFITDHYNLSMRTNIDKERPDLMETAIMLDAKSGNIPDFPTGFEIMGNLVFDRVLNANPVSLGMKNSAFACVVDSNVYQLSL